MSTKTICPDCDGAGERVPSGFGAESDPEECKLCSGTGNLQAVHQPDEPEDDSTEEILELAKLRMADKKTLQALRTELEIEQLKQDIAVLKLGSRLNAEKRKEKAEEILAEIVLEVLPDLKTVLKALAVVLAAHITAAGPSTGNVTPIRKE